MYDVIVVEHAWPGRPPRCCSPAAPRIEQLMLFEAIQGTSSRRAGSSEC